MEIINSLNLLNYSPQSQTSAYDKRGSDCCSMVRAERTAGSIPSYNSFWSTSSAKTQVLTQDEKFERLVQEQLNPEEGTYSLTLDEQEMETGVAKENRDRFDVFDFLDMINPLQHIPVLNYAYRHLTGDDIKPISAIIGGAVFAGPAGAASGLVTSMVEHETGGNLPETMFSMASGENKFGAYEKTASFVDARSVKTANYDYNT